MGLEPTRHGATLVVKKIMDALLARFAHITWLDADKISGLSLVCSLLVNILFSKRMMIGGLFALFSVLFLDALDGAVARVKGQATSKEGWIVDVSVDRISEVFISIALSRVFIFLAIFNTGLTIYSYKFKRCVIIPLRQFLFFILIFYFIIKSQPITLLLEGVLFDW